MKFYRSPLFFAITLFLRMQEYRTQILLRSAGIFVFFVLLSPWMFPRAVFGEVREYPIIIDPGHGGADSRRLDDKWDPITGKYLSYYLSGMKYKDYYEYKIMMDLSRDLKKILDLTRTDEGWIEFQELLKTFSPQKEFVRIRFRTDLTHDEVWNERFSDPEAPHVNDDYRLYDFPEDPNEPSRIMPGRWTYANQKEPYLIVSLHMNPAGAGHPGGMAGVLTPGYRTFDLIRKIHLNQESIRKFKKLPWVQKGKWLISDPGWSVYESARADAWVYFHGYRSNKSGTGIWEAKNRGIRYNMVTWPYRDPPGWEKIARLREPGPYSLDYTKFRSEGKFFDRERSDPEKWRREDGYLGFGGDNHLATDELMRFVQLGVRNQVPDRNKRSGLGPINPPYISAYGLPTFVNAIVAYLEIGYLDRKRDRTLMLEHRMETARSLAVGIYSLFAGLKIKHNPKSPYHPRGKAVDFEKYENYKEGNYFKLVAQ